MEKLHCEAFEQTLPTEHALMFLKWEKFLQGSDGEFTEQLVACSVSTRCTDSDEKQTPSWHHSVYCGN